MADIYPETGGARDSDPLKDQAREAREKLGEAGQTVKQEAAHFAQAAREKVEEKAQGGADAAAGALGVFADAIRKAGDELGQQDQTMAARLASQAAEGLEGLSRSFADKRPEDLLHAVRDFGRANPAAFLAGSVLAGLALGRFARSSAQHPHQASGETSASDQAAQAAQAAVVGPAGETYEAPGMEELSARDAFPARDEELTSLDDAVAGDAGLDALSGDETLDVEDDRGRI